MITSKKFTTIFFLSLFFIGGIFCGYFLNFSGKKERATTFVFNRDKTVTEYHNATQNKKDFFEKAFGVAEDKKILDDKNIKGLIVPHHILAARLIASAFENVLVQEFSTVVVLAPNHFSKGNGQIISSLYDWKTPYGALEAETELIKKLKDNNLVNIDETPFAEEHGIYNLMPFIKKTMPEAKVVPIIIKDKIKEEEINNFAKKLKETLPGNTLVVGSLDFSHYLPSNAADFHDAKSLAVINNFDYSGIDFLDIDSKPTLKVLLKYLELEGAQNFAMLDNSNSAKILNDNSIAETTSYITGFFSGGEKSENKDITLLSFGDIMLDRYIRKTIDKNGENYPYSKIERFLGGSDLVLANLEGSFTDFAPKPLHPDNTTFTFDPKSAPVLKKIGFNIFNLANNHAFNFGKDGFDQSINYLSENSIDYFGAPNNLNKIYTIENIRGVKIGFVGYSELGTDNFDKVIDEVKKIKQEVDFVVVYTHWGTEYKTMFSGGQQKMAHELIDAGADLVLGSHPHVVQPIEVYKNKIIFYSLGNFLFDQIFSRETMSGLGVGAVFGEKKIEYYLFPTEIDRNFQIILPDQVKSSNILKELARDSVASEETKKQMEAGKIIINNQSNN